MKKETKQSLDKMGDGGDGAKTMVPRHVQLCTQCSSHACFAEMPVTWSVCLNLASDQPNYNVCLFGHTNAGEPTVKWDTEFTGVVRTSFQNMFEPGVLVWLLYISKYAGQPSTNSRNQPLLCAVSVTTSLAPGNGAIFRSCKRRNKHDRAPDECTPWVVHVYSCKARAFHGAKYIATIEKPTHF